MGADPDRPAQPVDAWNDILAPKFIAWRHILVGGFTHHSARIFPTLDVREGDRALDVGCGFGDTAVELARRVGPAGRVTGIDFCRPFLDIARRDAEAAGVGNVTFVEGDAAVFAFRPEYDFWFSRFGTMCFTGPVAGLGNIRSALKPGGRMTMIVWRALEDNPWVDVARQIALSHLPQPDSGAAQPGPGQFSMADEATVREQLASAGYAGIGFERIDAPIRVGGSVDEAVEFQLALGPVGGMLREAGDEGARHREAIAAALTDALSGYATEDGVFMGSSTWKVSARNPA